jgi:hypothetical protein
VGPKILLVALGIMPLSSPSLLNPSMVNAFPVPVAGTLMFKSSRPSLTCNQVRDTLLDLIHYCILYTYISTFLFLPLSNFENPLRTYIFFLIQKKRERERRKEKERKDKKRKGKRKK